MGRKAVLALAVIVAAVTSVDIAPVFADQTGLASIHVLRRERGHLCMADHWHYGSSGTFRSKRAATRDAIRSWSDFTNLEYGSDWARWGRAHSRKVTCSPASAGWNCNVEARPCL